MKGEYISMETSKIMADIEKENKELHDRIEKLEKINKRLWEENARLSNGRELDQNVIDTLRERIDKTIEYIEGNAPWGEETEDGDFVSGKLLQDDDIDYVLEILKGE